jgi:hypothetical protein
MAAFLMEGQAEDIDFADGIYRMQGTNKSMPLQEVAKAFFRPAGIPMELGVGLEGHGSWASEPGNFPNGCHACEVEIDPDTGAVAVVRYACVDDLGLVINPMIVEGQIHGALAQGLGQALMGTSSATGTRATGVGQLHRLRHAARRRFPALRHRLPQRAGQDQSAGRQGRGRGRLHRRSPGDHERDPRRPASAGREGARHAGDPAARLAGDPGRQGLSGVRPLRV